MAQTLHFVTAQAASGKDEPRHETQILRLELELHVASPWYQRNLVCAGRGRGSCPFCAAEYVRRFHGDQLMDVSCQMA